MSDKKTSDQTDLKARPATAILTIRGIAINVRSGNATVTHDEAIAADEAIAVDEAIVANDEAVPVHHTD